MLCELPEADGSQAARFRIGARCSFRPKFFGSSRNAFEYYDGSRIPAVVCDGHMSPGDPKRLCSGADQAGEDKTWCAGIKTPNLDVEPWKIATSKGLRKSLFRGEAASYRLERPV